MKYFVDAEAREAAGHENYIEFQLPTATDEFWDKTSLYMLEETMDESGFGEFWSNCMYDGIVFDMASFSEDELKRFHPKQNPVFLYIVSRLLLQMEAD